MIRLSERMEHIVELAKPEESGNVFACLAEIGCDHAYITMEIVRRGYAKAGIAMDVKEGPLRRAAKNIEIEFNLAGEKRVADCLTDSPHSGKIDTRLSNGLMKLKEGEADLLVIAGMGGGLICRILEEGKQVSDLVPVWILQPQTECYELRKYLLGRNQLIVKEDMVLEDGKFYPMFRVVHKENRAYYGKISEITKKEEIKLKYGPLLLKEKHPCLLKYLLWKENANRELFRLLQHENSPKAAERRRELESEYLEIQEVKKAFYL